MQSTQGPRYGTMQLSLGMRSGLYCNFWVTVDVGLLTRNKDLTFAGQFPQFRSLFRVPTIRWSLLFRARETRPPVLELHPFGFRFGVWSLGV